MSNIKDFIKKAQRAYQEGNPIISNEEYDALLARFPNAEEHIGHKGEVRHKMRMWSLEKKYPCRGDELPSNIGDYIRSPKLDGCAVSALYYDGEFVLGLTRGDGVLGRDVTQNLDHLLPAYIPAIGGVVQITGEVTTTKDVKNKRNFASGAVNLDSEDDFLAAMNEGGLQFIAYNLQIEGTNSFPNYVEDMLWLSTEADIATVVSKSVEKLVNEGRIPTDGEVYRLNSNAAYYAAGFTSKFPKGAFALKEDEEGIWTEIEDVLWQVGASGKVTPVAIIKEVVIDDAKITRVTLNNLEYMEALGIAHIGQEVQVIRAGGIIPKIVGAR